MPLEKNERQVLDYLVLYKLHQEQIKIETNSIEAAQSAVRLSDRALASLGGLLTRVGQHLEQRFGAAVVEADGCLN